MRSISPANLLQFLNEASGVNHTYFRARRTLFETFKSMVVLSVGTLPAEHIAIPNNVFSSISLFLTARNEAAGSNDNARLAFQTAIDELMALLDNYGGPDLADVAPSSIAGAPLGTPARRPLPPPAVSTPIRRDATAPSTPVASLSASHPTAAPSFHSSQGD